MRYIPQAASSSFGWIFRCGSSAETFPQIMCGDFNSGIKAKPSLVLREAGWKEMWETMHGQKEYGHTYHGFKGDEYTSKNLRRIDFIYYHGAVTPTLTEVIKDRIKGIYPSDHYFMVADFTLQ